MTQGSAAVLGYSAQQETTMAKRSGKSSKKPARKLALRKNTLKDLAPSGRTVKGGTRLIGVDDPITAPGSRPQGLKQP